MNNKINILHPNTAKVIIFMYIKLKSTVPFMTMAYNTIIIEFNIMVSMIEIEFDIYAFFVMNNKMTEIGTIK